MKNAKINMLLSVLNFSSYTNANLAPTITNSQAKFLYTLNNKDSECIALIYQIDPTNGSLRFRSQQTFNLSQQEIISLNTDLNGAHAYLISSDQIYAYDINQTTGELTRNTNLDIYDDFGNIANFCAMKFHSNGKYIYTFSFHKLTGKIKIAIWELQNGKYQLLNTINDKKRRYSSKLEINLSNDGHYLYISTKFDAEIHIYQIADEGRIINHINSIKIGQLLFLDSFTINPKNNHLFTFNNTNNLEFNHVYKHIGTNIGEYIPSTNSLKNLKNTPLNNMSFTQSSMFSPHSRFIYVLGFNNYNGRGALYSIDSGTSSVLAVNVKSILSCYNARFNIDRQGDYLYLYADEAHQLQSFAINKQNGSISAINQLNIPNDFITKSITIQN